MSHFERQQEVFILCAKTDPACSTREDVSPAIDSHSFEWERGVVQASGEDWAEVHIDTYTTEYEARFLLSREQAEKLAAAIGVPLPEKSC